MQGDVASGLQMVSLAAIKILTDYVPRQEIQKTNDIPNIMKYGENKKDML